MNQIIKIVILLLLSASFLSAQEVARVVVFTSSRSPAAETTWSLTLLVAHHEPDEVNVFAPHFTGSLFLDQVIKVPRYYNPSTRQATSSVNEVRASETPWAFEHWTAVEFRFTLNNPGEIEFEAFTVATPYWEAETAPFTLDVQKAQNTAQIQSHRLVWEGAPASLIVGENAVFSLRVSNWNSSGMMPEMELFLPPVPPGYIIESISLTPEERSAGIALRLRLIPLTAAAFVLESRRLSQDDALFEIPSLRIPVSRVAADAAIEESEPEIAGAIVPFPPLSAAMEGNAGLYQKHMAECESVCAAARTLWEQGNRVNALAELRRNERDHPAGMFFAALRRSAEQSLGFSGTHDEKKGVLAFFRGMFKGRFPSSSAVLTETVVRRVPNMTGTEFARFREGQPVLLDKKSPKVREGGTIWQRVIANDETRTSGWVPEASIVFY